MNTPSRTITLALFGLLAAATPAAWGDQRPATRPSKPAAAAPAPAGRQTMVCGVVGLFAADREADLRAAVAALPDVQIVAVDFDHGEATFSYDPAAAGFKGAAPDKVVERLDQLVRNASGHLFGVRRRSAAAPDKLTKVEVDVAPLDCKACALAVHEMVCKLDGVSQAAVDMKTGRITATVDPDKADGDKIRAALKAREVVVRQP